MARKIRHSALETRTSRLKLKVRRKPYAGPSLARGVSLMYRRNRGNGSWVLKCSNGHGAYWTRAIGEADDFDNVDGGRILDYFTAQDVAKHLARGGPSGDTAPITVGAALDNYKRDLESRNADPYNATWPRRHLSASLLAKPIPLLTATELRRWRDGLLGKISPATINRLCNAICAALELAARHDERIQNRSAWQNGLAGLPDAQTARNVVLPDDQVRAFVAAAYQRDANLGLIVDTLAATGARPSQVVRLLVEDLHAGPKPRLAMPRSGKGGGLHRSAKRNERYSVPITPQLAAKLQAAARGRASDAPLLLQSSGIRWPADPSVTYRDAIRAIVDELGLDPDVTTVYALRHSSIVRMLLRNVPIRLTAALHDTGISQIERNYARFISEHGDDHARAALLQLDGPAAANVVPLVR